MMSQAVMRMGRRWVSKWRWRETPAQFNTRNLDGRLFALFARSSFTRTAAAVSCSQRPGAVKSGVLHVVCVCGVVSVQKLGGKRDGDRASAIWRFGKRQAQSSRSSGTNDEGTSQECAGQSTPPARCCLLQTVSLSTPRRRSGKQRGNARESAIQPSTRRERRSTTN